MAQETRPLVEGKYLEYLDKPLVREENTICYGDMNDKCILILEIMSTKNVGGKEIPEKILIQVAGCDKITRTIDFILAEEDGEEEF